MDEPTFEQLMLTKLSQIEIPENRLYFKNIVEAGFLAIARHDEAQYADLTNRVFSEIRADQERLVVHTSIVRRAALDPTHSYLRPVLPEDADKPVVNFDEMKRALEAGEPFFLHRVFFECDALALHDLLAFGRTFRADIQTDVGTVQAQARITPSRAYTGRIEWLYRVFVHNKAAWTPVHHPYLHKYVDVTIQPVSAPGNIRSVVVDFEEYASRVWEDRVPLWNIETIDVRGAGFAEPSFDRLTYQHRIALHEPGLEHGYLVDYQAGELEHVRRLPDSLVIVASEESVKSWPLLKIVQRKSRESEKSEYPVFSNQKKRSYAAALSSVRLPLRTRAELFQYLYAFEASEAVGVSRIDTLEDGEFVGETYDIHPFLSDEIRMGKYARSLRITFESRLPEELAYLARDVMSFLVAQLSLLYPEYNCRGVLA